MRQELVDKGIILKKGTNPSVDFEPEYIAAGNNTAYVTLQEANAIAVIDLSTNKVTGIYSAGFEDYSKVAVDIDKKDEKYNAKTYEISPGHPHAGRHRAIQRRRHRLRDHRQ